MKKTFIHNSFRLISVFFVGLLLINWTFIVYDYDKYIKFLEIFSPDNNIINPVGIISEINIALLFIIILLSSVDFKINIQTKNLKKYLYLLIVFEVILLIIYFFIIYSEYTSSIIFKIFDLDGELNLPAIFSSFQYVMISIVFLSISKKRTSFRNVLFFLTISFLFLFLSLDEAVKIHERLSSFLVDRFEITLFYSIVCWISIYLFFGIFILIVFYSEFKGMVARYKKEIFIMAIGVFFLFLGAAFFEIISHKIFSGGKTLFLWSAEVAVEEFLEMFGVSLFLYGTMLYKNSSSLDS